MGIIMIMVKGGSPGIKDDKGKMTVKSARVGRKRMYEEEEKEWNKRIMRE